MFTVDQARTQRRRLQRAYTLIELLVVTFVVAVTAATGKLVAIRYGIGPGIGAGFLAALGAALIVVLFYRWSWRRDERRLRELKENHQGIYRVNALPFDQRSVMKPEGAEIRIGDYGWEAGPKRRDGLIYLHGLTPEWTVVWYAGFHPDQIQRVATKPCSQYGHWVPYWARKPALPPCPFPVVERETLTTGLPHPSHRFVEMPTLYRPKRADPGAS